MLTLLSVTGGVYCHPRSHTGVDIRRATEAVIGRRRVRWRPPRLLLPPPWQIDGFPFRRLASCAVQSGGRSHYTWRTCWTNVSSPGGSS